MQSFMPPWGGPDQAKLMPLELHRHIKFGSTEIEIQRDGTIRTVHVLYTDLELSSISANYDANAVEELINRIRAHQKSHHELIRLRTIA